MLHCIRNILCVAPIFVLAGCWQKIEYSGKPTTSTKAPVPSDGAKEVATDVKPAAAQMSDPSPVSSPVADIPPAPPVKEFQPVAATPIPPAPAESKNEDDRYALPPAQVDVASNSKFAAAKSSGPAAPAAPEWQQPKRHTDATPVSASVDVRPTPVSPRIRRAAWALGSRLSLAALAHDRRMAANSVPTWLDEAHSACKILETSVPELPAPAAAGDTAPASRQVIDYLLAEGQRIGRDLAKRYGPEQAALFEVALKSNILLLLYSPGSNATNSISAAISRAAPQAKLPEALWKPLVDRVNSKSSLEDVRTAVKQMHSDVDGYLANAGEPSSR